MTLIDHLRAELTDEEAKQWGLAQFEAIDPTEYALHHVFEVADDFRQAIRTAESPHRIVQLRERLKVAVAELVTAQDAAAERAEQLTRKEP